MSLMPEAREMTTFGSQDPEEIWILSNPQTLFSIVQLELISGYMYFPRLNNIIKLFSTYQEPDN